MTLIASIITFSKKKKIGKKMLPSTLDKKIDSIQLGQILTSVTHSLFPDVLYAKQNEGYLRMRKILI